MKRLKPGFIDQAREGVILRGKRLLKILSLVNEKPGSHAPAFSFSSITTDKFSILDLQSHRAMPLRPKLTLACPKSPPPRLAGTANPTLGCVGREPPLEFGGNDLNPRASPLALAHPQRFLDHGLDRESVIENLSLVIEESSSPARAFFSSITTNKFSIFNFQSPHPCLCARNDVSPPNGLLHAAAPWDSERYLWPLRGRLN